MKQWYSMKDRKACEELRDMLLETLEGKEYLFAFTTDQEAEIDLHLNHHLEPNLKNEKVGFFEWEGEINSIHINDSYGVHFIDKDILRYVHVSHGQGRIEIRTRLNRVWSDQKLGDRVTVFQITGDYVEE